jgi:hypothetical protein
LSRLRLKRLRRLGRERGVEVRIDGLKGKGSLSPRDLE